MISHSNLANLLQGTVLLWFSCQLMIPLIDELRMEIIDKVTSLIDWKKSKRHCTFCNKTNRVWMKVQIWIIWNNLLWNNVNLNPLIFISIIPHQILAILRRTSVFHHNKSYCPFLLIFISDFSIRCLKVKGWIGMRG